MLSRVVTQGDKEVRFMDMDALRKILSEAIENPGEADRIGRKIGTSGQSIRNWADGTYTPSASVIPALAKELGRDLYELYGEPRPGGPVGYSETERLLVSVIRLLRIDPQDVVRAIYSLPRPAIEPDPGVRQLSGYNLGERAADHDLEPPPAERDADDPRPGKRGRGK